MNLPGATVAAVLFLTVSSSARAGEGNPLESLAETGRLLDKGIDAFLAGASSVEAFNPWAVRELSGKKLTKVRSKLKAAGVVKGIVSGFELELIFYAKEKAIYYLRAYVQTDGKSAQFLRLAGRIPAEGKIYVSGNPIGEYQGVTKPFANAAGETLKSLKEGNTSGFAFANVDRIKKLGGGEHVHGRAERWVKEAQQNLGKVAEQLKSIQADRIDLRLDDLSFYALDANGKAVGFIQAELDLAPKGNLGFRIKGFRPFRK